MNTNTVVAALDALMRALDLNGESGTEELCHVLDRAIHRFDWFDQIEASHEEGLCIDMRFALADALIANRHR